MKASRDNPENTRSMLLFGGSLAVMLGYAMPAIVFKGTGNAVHDLSMIEKLPVLSALAFVALAAAIAARFVPRLQRWSEHATVAAIVMIVAPALFGFVASLDVWSGLRAMIVEIAGTRNLRIDPGPGYVPMLIGAGMLAMSLRGSARRDQAAEAA